MKKGQPQAASKEVSHPQAEEAKKRPAYETISVDPQEFYQRYNKFLEEDKDNKKKQAEYLKAYLENTGLKMAFRVIAAEAIKEELRPDQVLAHAAKRLKEIGREIEKLGPGGNSAPTKSTVDAPKKK